MASDLYYYRPSTPPASLTAAQFAGNVHSRSASGGSSVYNTNDSSPETVGTNITTPSRSPAFNQHGPTLLPKIRPQDVVVEPVSRSGPYRHRRALSNSLNPPGFVPYTTTRPSGTRSVAEPVDCSLLSPISTTHRRGDGAHLGSTLTSPIYPSQTQSQSQSRRRTAGHSRSTSATCIDEAMLKRYGSSAQVQPPTPKYVSDYSPTTPASAASFVFPTYQQQHSRGSYPPQQQNVSVSQPHTFAESTARTLGAVPAAVDVAEDPSTTTLLQYLTAPTQAVHLVRNLAYPMTRTSQLHFWWDVRNLRRWSSFSLDAINSIPNLAKLLTTELSEQLVPPTSVNPSRLSPESETGLANVIRDIYAPRVNAALKISQGQNCLSLYSAPDSASSHESGAHFLANYATDTERTLNGTPRGRVVGLVKSFDQWNTGMRNEPPHRRVVYLNGLAHLQQCMRENSCRYGFIMTEIELVCVRAGCDEGDDVPYFGYLELAAPIATKTSSSTYNPAASGLSCSRASSASAQSSDYSGSSRSVSPANHPSSSSNLPGPFTATLALYYLLMLAKSVPLPGQPSSHLNVGGPGALTRQRILPDGKDKWIPEPQQRERRDAKRIRGWIWPQDAWHRREGGGSSRAKTNKPSAAKRWHK